MTAGGADFGTRTAPDGTFAIENAPPDFGKLRVFPAGCESIWLDEVPDADLRDLEIVVDGCALAAVRVGARAP